MVTRRLLKIMLLMVFVLAAVVMVAQAEAQPKNFRAHLAGRNEGPVPVDTQAQGQAIFQLSADGLTLRYKLIATNIDNVFMAHIHRAAEGTNGPIVAWLYPSAPPAQLIAGRSTGILMEGEITAANLTGPLAGQPLSELIAAVEAGNTYVNVHTTDGVAANNPPQVAGDAPAGEIRGQISG